MQPSLLESSQVVVDDQRRSWFVSEMRKERTTFTSEKELSLFAGTWNVNGRPPNKKTDLPKWLFPPSQGGRPVDVYMLGLQEVQTLQGVDAVRSDTGKAIIWRNAIENTLGSDYERVAERQLVGILVLVFLRSNHSPYLSNVQLSYAATGFLNAVGNKGGVAVRFMLYDRTFACVACHLAAHIQNLERRTQDFIDVVRKAVFMPVSSDRGSEPPSLQLSALTKSMPTSSALARVNTSYSDPLGFSDVASGTSAWLGSVATAFSDISAGANTTYLNDPNAIKVLDHDMVFWLGDLNYRLDADEDKVLSWIENHNWAQLYNADQLQREMKTHEIFTGFREGPLRFPPTYKYDRTTNEYARDEQGQLKRKPAYTDRILWRIGTDDDDPRGMPDLRLQEYASATSVYTSDHRPVYATFLMKVGVEDVSRRRTAEEKINRELDRRQANIKSSLQVSASSVDLGDVFFDQECSRHIVIRNTGPLRSFFSVAVKNVPPWLFFDHGRWQNVELPPNKSVTMPIRVAIDEKDGLANYVASRGCALETVLELTGEPGHLKKSIQVSGRYLPTVLGLSLGTLAMSAGPVVAMRETRRNGRESAYEQHMRDIEGDNRKGPGAAPLPIPKEIWLLVNALLTVHDGEDKPYMWYFPNLFLKKGEEIDVQRVLSLIDRGEPIPEDIGGYAIATCLLNVLRFLDGSIIPAHAYKRAVEAGYTQDEEVVSGLVNLLPPLNRNVFWYLIGFLCEIPLVRDRDEGAKDLALEFGKALIRSNQGSNSRDLASKGAFVMAAIQHQLDAPAPRFFVTIDLANPETHPRAQQRSRK